MHPFFSRFLYLLGVILLGACSSVGQFVPTQPLNPNNDILYVYRPAASNPGVAKPYFLDYPDVLIDGLSIGVLKYGEYIVAEITPGAHTIRITGLTPAAHGWGERDIQRKFVTGKNNQNFIKLQVEYNLNNMNLGQPSAQYNIGLTPVDEDNAIYEIRDTIRSSR